MTVAEDIADFLSGVWQAITGRFSTSPPTAVTKPCPAGALTPQQASNWFDRFRNDISIPWNYPNDCCYTRAEVMAEQLRGGGVDVGKVWNYAPDAMHTLQVATPNDPGGFVQWGYHVAPTVPVEQSDGSVQPMVLDPSIASGPITPQQWKDMQGQPSSTLVFTDASPYYRAPDGRVESTPSSADMQNQFVQHRLDRQANWAASGRIPP